MREAWTIAIETMSWMELRRLNERSALVRTTKQLNINEPQAMRFAYGLIVETTRRKNLIDKLINDVIAPKKISELDQGLQAFLRLYVYQTRVQKNWGKYNLKEADNIAGLGRNILGWEAMREIEPYLGFLLTRKINPIIDAASVAEKIGLETYNPTWFVEYCFAHFGKEDAVAFLLGSLTPPPTYIRINTLAGTEEEILSKLTAEGIKLEKVELLKYTYKVIQTQQTLNNSPSLEAGLFYVQDKASCFATQAANPLPENTVFDICAAPGAKTTFLAQLMGDEGSITSMDFSAKRMKTWQKETKRMGTKIASPLVADARVSIPLMGEADLLVLDPPCTSSGVFAKQPSAKWRLSPRSIQNMSEIQLKMINNCADKVKKGGYLAYSTCSVTVEENEGVIEAFLKANPDFKLIEIEPKIGLPGLKGLTACQRLYPHVHHCNGFFIAKLQKQ
ncbi:MAG TPA: RsmB/NOP family class I SAM-dependent RNA methyltransferase [Candidatus Acidoferrales bacterium]|nr:RsmB/NOP family class I SAM-dependent RNA methyltransferase [Candidatus Acidoferrales bacterium]